MATAEATIGSLAPWFGSKRTMAPAIIRELGPHNVYWELFCGSMAVLLSKPPCPTEVVNDLHGDLVNLARCVQHADLGPMLYRRLRRVLCCQATFLASRSVIRGADSPPAEGDPDIDRAHAYFVASWQRINGVSGTSNCHNGFARRFSSKGGGPAKRWEGAVSSIPAWRRRLRNVQILSSDGLDLAENVEDRKGTVLYADPPYLVKGAKYVHDFDDADHVRLAVALRRFRETRVVVSYYDHPRLAELYPGWSVRRVDFTKTMVSSGMRDQAGVTKAPEVLIVNGPLARDDSFGLFAEDAS